MDATNINFIARQLALTELHGEVEEIPAGILVWNIALWAALWNPELIVEPESFILEVKEKSKVRDIPWHGVLLLLQPGNESANAFLELCDALFVYGFERLTGMETGGPDMVQILGAPPKLHMPSGLEIKESRDKDEITPMFAHAEQLKDSFSSPWRRNQPNWMGGCRIITATLNGKLAAAAVLRESDLASRLDFLWVEPGHRDKGIGAALISYCAEQATSRGKMLNTAWTYRDGKLRYYLRKQGFEEQLSAHYCIGEIAIT